MEDIGLLMELAEEVAELKARVAILEARQYHSLARFTPPTVEDVRKLMVEYCVEKGYRTNANPQEFVDFYESNGWKVGKVSMKNWPAAARNWCRRNRRVENKVGTEAYHRHGL